MTLDSAFREMLRDVVRDEVRTALRDVEARRTPTPRQPPIEQYLTADHAAELIGVRPQTIRSWAARGELLACYAGRKLRIKLSDLHNYMERPREGSDLRAEHEDAAFIKEMFREDALRCSNCGHLQRLHQEVKCSAHSCKCLKWTTS